MAGPQTKNFLHPSLLDMESHWHGCSLKNVWYNMEKVGGSGEVGLAPHPPVTLSKFLLFMMIHLPILSKSMRYR